MPAAEQGRVAGKVVIVTGAAQGQGAAESLALALEGAIVVAADLRDDPPDDLREAGGHSGAGQVSYQRLDVSSQEQWAALTASVAERHGRIDGLVNNAGIPFRARLADVSVADWERVLAVNLTGTLLGIQAVLPYMRSGGSIVNVGSVAALSGHYTVAYTVSKWGVRGLSRVASMELGPRGIRVNAIHPGFIETPMTARPRRPSARRTSLRSPSAAPARSPTWHRWSCSCCPRSRRSSPAPRSRWTAARAATGAPNRCPTRSAPPTSNPQPEPEREPARDRLPRR